MSICYLAKNLQNKEKDEEMRKAPVGTGREEAHQGTLVSHLGAWRIMTSQPRNVRRAGLTTLRSLRRPLERATDYLGMLFTGAGAQSVSADEAVPRHIGLQGRTLRYQCFHGIIVSWVAATTVARLRKRKQRQKRRGKVRYW